MLRFMKYFVITKYYNDEEYLCFVGLCQAGKFDVSIIIIIGMDIIIVIVISISISSSSSIIIILL